MPAVEYSVTHDRHLPGAERTASPPAWFDTFASNRAAERRLLHTQFRYLWKGQQTVAHYEWLHARDNTDGPFSFPQQPGHVDAEWARSAGLSPHTVTLVGTFALPGSIAVTLSEVWRSAAPYNITTGRDRSGNGLFNDRGGLPRNSGKESGYDCLSLYATRHVPLPRLLGTTRWLHPRISLHADNLLDRKNDVATGSVIGSPTFGRPLVALPGRSLRLFFSVG